VCAWNKSFVWAKKQSIFRTSEFGVYCCCLIRDNRVVGIMYYIIYYIRVIRFIKRVWFGCISILVRGGAVPQHTYYNTLVYYNMCSPLRQNVLPVCHCGFWRPRASKLGGLPLSLRTLGIIFVVTIFTIWLQDT